jgi:hypothetical protein
LADGRHGGGVVVIVIPALLRGWHIGLNILISDAYIKPSNSSRTKQNQRPKRANSDQNATFRDFVHGSELFYPWGSIPNTLCNPAINGWNACKLAVPPFP